MKYAVIKTGGKQYKVSEGDVLEVEHMKGFKPEDEVVFDHVLLVADGADVQIGTPLVSGVTVRAILKEEMKGEKIRVVKYKAKVRHRRVRGHRQSLSKVAIQSIGQDAKVRTKSVEQKISSAKRTTRKKTA